jgi:transcriptional regulator with XRE-family HTH domain
MPDSIGKRLKQARESLHLTLDKAAEATRIRRHYLQALENDDYSLMSSAAQGRGFLRIYADYLGLNLDQLTADLRAGVTSPHVVSDAPAPVPLAEPTSRPAPFWSRLTRRPASETPPAESVAAPVAEERLPAAAPAPQPAPVAGPEIEAVPLVEEAAVAPVRKPRATRKSSAAKSARGAKSASKKESAGRSRSAARKKSPVKKNSQPSRLLKS